MDKTYKVQVGDLIIRNSDQFIGFDPGNEFDTMIWVSYGTTDDRAPIYNENLDVIGTEAITDINPIDLFTGKKCEWGLHMFMTYEEFMCEYNRIRFFMYRDSNYLKKLTYDLNHKNLHKINDLRRIQIINAIIHQVNLFFEGIESGEILVPLKTKSVLSERTITLLHNIAELTPFDVPTPSELEQIKQSQNNDDFFKEAAQKIKDIKEQERPNTLQAEFESAMDSYDDDVASQISDIGEEE